MVKVADVGEVIIVEVGLAARVAIRAVEIKAESSRVTPVCAAVESSDEDDEESVDIEAVAGYRERLPAATFSACWYARMFGADDVLTAACGR